MSRSHVATPAERASVRDLELVARTVVEGLRQGLHRSPFHGYNAEFSQYRHYRPGDDLKYVDWKAFGRTDRLYTRQFRETTSLSALFVCDLSRSMDYGAKFPLAQVVTSVLGTLVIDQGDAAGLLALGAAGRVSYLPSRSGHHHLTLFLAAVSRLTPDSAAPVTDALARAAVLLKRRAMVVVVTDLYDDERTLVELRKLKGMGHDVIVVHVISEDELTLPDRGAVEYVDSETDRTLVVQPERAQAAYRQRVGGWLAGVERALAREGLAYVRVTRRATLEQDLRRFLVARRGAA